MIPPEHSPHTKESWISPNLRCRLLACLLVAAVGTTSAVASAALGNAAGCLERRSRHLSQDTFDFLPLNIRRSLVLGLRLSSLFCLHLDGNPFARLLTQLISYVKTRAVE